MRLVEVDCFSQPLHRLVWRGSQGLGIYPRLKGPTYLMEGTDPLSETKQALLGDAAPTAGEGERGVTSTKSGWKNGTVIYAALVSVRRDKEFTWGWRLSLM